MTFHSLGHMEPSHVQKLRELHKKMLDFKFVCSIVIWYDILFEINISSITFLEKDLDLKKSIQQLLNAN